MVEKIGYEELSEMLVFRDSMRSHGIIDTMLELGGDVLYDRSRCQEAKETYGRKVSFSSGEVKITAIVPLDRMEKIGYFMENFEIKMGDMHR